MSAPVQTAGSALRRTGVRAAPVLAYAVAFAGLVALFAASFAISTGADRANFDIYWSLRDGWTDVTHWQSVNTYNWIAYGYRLTHAEWLSDVFLYFVWRIGGFPGLFWMTRIASAGFLAALLTVYHHKRRLNAKSFLLIVVGYLILLSPFIVFRPQLFTYALVIVYLSNRDRRLWLWALLVPLWANLHGEYMVFFGMFLIDRVAARKWKELLWLPVFALEVFALTPLHGYTLAYPFLTLFSHTIQQHITEWQSYPFHLPYFLFAYLLILAYAALYGKGLSARDRALGFILFLMTMDSVRDLALLAIFLLCTFDFGPSTFSFPVRNASILAAGAFMAAAALTPVPAHLAPRGYAALSRIVSARSAPGSRWYFPNFFSEYMEWHRPQIPAYTDGRVDLFAGFTGKGEKNVFLPILNASSGQAPLQTLPGYRQMTGMVVPIGRALSNQLRYMPEWTKVAEAGGFAVYLRTANVKAGPPAIPPPNNPS